MTFFFLNLEEPVSSGGRLERAAVGEDKGEHEGDQRVMRIEN